MSSKLIRLTFPAVVLVVASGLWCVRALRAQAPGTVWEYATVESLQEFYQGNAKYSVANICYHVSSGCR